MKSLIGLNLVTLSALRDTATRLIDLARVTTPYPSHFLTQQALSLSSPTIVALKHITSTYPTTLKQLVTAITDYLIVTLGTVFQLTIVNVILHSFDHCFAVLSS